MEDIWKGIKAIFVGGRKIVVGVAKAAWSVIKFAVKACVWVVAGIFTIAEHLASYVRKTLTSLFKPEKAVVIPDNKVLPLIEFMNEQAEKDGIAEDPDIMEIKAGLKEAAKNGQSMVFTIGKDNENQDAVSDPQFVSAASFDEKIKDARDRNQIYVKPIRIAH